MPNKIANTAVTASNMQYQLFPAMDKGESFAMEPASSNCAP